MIRIGIASAVIAAAVGTAFVVPAQIAVLRADEPAVTEPAKQPESKPLDLQQAEQNRFFEIKIRPLLVKRCFECHADKKQSGELRADHISTLLTGGESGPAIVPGKPDESLLMEAVRWESFEMPPEGKLPEEEIQLLEQWIGQGAYWPATDKAPKAISAVDQISDEERNWWAYQPIDKPALPAAAPSGNPIDAFITRKQREHGFESAPPADRATLARRLYFDLWGLPPSASQVDDFINNDDSLAVNLLVDELLASPHYGEHWGRHWLDVVRYAESDGWRKDDYRPDAWRYRDYVIDSFNNDKPYDQFVREQLAGDEIAPHDPQALAATGFLHLGIYEYNQRDAVTQWQNIVDEITDVTGDVFLATGLACSRCHNHKFDTLFREDYYRVRSFFEPLQWEDSTPFATTDELLTYETKQKLWEEKTADIRQQMRAIEQEYIDKRAESAVVIFPLDVQAAYRKPASERNSFEHQMTYLVQRQVDDKVNAADWKNLKGEKKTRWQALDKQLKEFDAIKPKALPTVLTVSDTSGPISPTKVPGSSSEREYQPGFLKVLSDINSDSGTDPDIQPPAAVPESSGRRLALANWIASRDNPLTARVIVNRIWQYHFGTGIVPSANDFGHLGEKPSHSDLLDWLAATLVENNWSMKSIHRLILTSTTWQQSAFHPQAAEYEIRDPLNIYRWRSDIRRLSAEEIRDAMLAATGELDETTDGPSLNGSHLRRSVYSRVMRNSPVPFLASLGAPDGIKSAPVRYVATTSSQALLLINGKYVYERAEKLAQAIQQQSPANLTEFIDQAFLRTTGKPATDKQKAQAIAFCQASEATGTVTTASPLDEVQAESLTDICHVLLNSSLFLYVD